jgi:predicted dehydrogenase
MIRVRMGMVGGGEGAFIGEIHRAAARLDGEVELVCGAFSSNPDVSRRTGTRLGLPPQRVYPSWQDMLIGESRLPAESRAEFVSIVTPNDLHLPVAQGALQAGFHVLSDKPATRSLAEARTLAAEVARTKRCYALTHTYLGYPLVAEARLRVLGGDIGSLRRVEVEYPQGWLATRLEESGNPQASWRTDPQRAGAGGSVGDIGVHAFNLAEYVTGLRVTRLCAALDITVPGRRLDDQASALLRFDNGAAGILTASQISAGEENDLTIRVYGETGGVIWSHRDPNSLQLLSLNGARRTLRAGNNVADLHASTRAQCRTPAGHPEGYIEAFANIYRLFATDVRKSSGNETGPAAPSSPATIEAALRGMAFIEAMVASSAAGQQWIDLAVTER